MQPACARWSDAQTGEVGEMTARSARQSVELSNPDRLLYPEQGTTKRDLANYYMSVAGFMLPYVEDRLLTLVRCPEGHHRDCFFQRHAKIGMPDSIREVDVLERNTRVKYVAIDDVLLFDLDPDPELPYARVLQGALRVRDELETFGLRSFVKTTGGKGLHVVVPVRPSLEWAETKLFCKAIAERIAHAEPEHYVTSVTKSRRKNKIFLDYLRNSRSATAIAPFSTRALPGAPVAAPLSWRELERSRQIPEFDIVSICTRLRRSTSDPWQDFLRVRQSVTLAMRRAVRAA
jgi:bifunctional non-homologous end joining protein LigD